MNAQFKTKLLQHIAKKNANKGFTLIELLVVVIIIGVLAAIALPNLLGQVGKARESEAKSTVGALNRAQQAYFTEKAAFATSTATLEVPTGNEKYYTISVSGAGVQLADGLDNLKNGTRDYMGGVSYNSTGRTFKTVACRGTKDPAFDLSVTNGVTNFGVTTGATAVACTGDTEEVK